jgi:mevalonate kinase
MQKVTHCVSAVRSCICNLNVSGCDVMFSRQAGEIEQSAYVAKVGTLVNTNHHLLNALGVGHGELTKIWEISRSAAMPSKLTGAGGGMFGWGKSLSCVMSRVVPMIRSFQF